METEVLTIFNEVRQPVGTATREDVHRLGLWHETFHCWFITKENGHNMICLQLRSPVKKDYPNLLDITAAGHLLATETVQDGVREIQEEIGVDVAYEDLHPLGLIPYSIATDTMIDNELAHVFIYCTDHPLKDFHVQEEEVAGLRKVAFADFAALWRGTAEMIPSADLLVDGKEDDDKRSTEISRENFVPHPVSYFTAVIEGIEKVLKK